jgi:hypothetical protein
MNRRQLALALLLAMLLNVPAVAGNWFEAGEAGDLFSTAQTLYGVGSLDSIFGSAYSPFDGDIYKISIANPAAFVATTRQHVQFDSILYLFDPAGHLWVAQDDDNGTGSTLFFGDGLSAPPAGEFYLAITPFNLRIEDSSGTTFFEAPGMTYAHSPSPISGSSVERWQNIQWQFDHFKLNGTTAGDYQIVLTGAQYVVPEPAAVVLAVPFAVALMGRRKR